MTTKSFIDILSYSYFNLIKVKDLFVEQKRINPELQLVLFGKIAAQVPEIHRFPSLVVEHPYNIRFITNSKVLAFFKPMDLLNFKECNEH
jgi:uracil-DNA glycosylase